MPQDSVYKNPPKNYEVTKLTTHGTIPHWLRGKLVRNGPALFTLKDATLRHWFDGYGMIHSFTIQDGAAYYQSRYTQSQEYLNATTSGKVQTVAWGTASDPCRSIFRRFMGNFTAVPTNTNVNIIKVGNKYFATSDIAALNQIDITSLETLSTFTATKNGVMAAHPSYTNDLTTWNMTAAFGPKVKNTFVSLSDAPAVHKHASFMTDKLFYFHSFGNTDRYMVAIEQPMRLDFGRLILSGANNKSFYECFTWDESFKNVFHVYDRKTHTMQHIPSDLSFFFFHTVNGYEENGELVIDLCAYKNNAIIDDFYIDNLSTNGIADEHKASLRRLRINLESQSLDMQDTHTNVELPNINDDYRNTKHRYVYGVHSPKGNKQLAVGIVKFDTANQTTKLWSEPDTAVGEPLFVADISVAKPKEDDGVLLVVAHNNKKQLAQLVVLDAKSLQVIARSDLPQMFPPALHGWFYKS